jgi:hypothetical protein
LAWSGWKRPLISASDRGWNCCSDILLFIFIYYSQVFLCLIGLPFALLILIIGQSLPQVNLD